MRVTLGCFTSLGLIINTVLGLNLAEEKPDDHDLSNFEVMDLTDFKKTGKQFLTNDDGELIQCFLTINKETNPAFVQFLGIFTDVAKKFSTNFSSFNPFSESSGLSTHFRS